MFWSQVKQLQNSNEQLKLKGDRYFRVADVEPRRKLRTVTNVKSLRRCRFLDLMPKDTFVCLPDPAVSTTTINDLNDDCLVLIFGQFSLGYTITFERVCKRWHQLLRRRWQRVQQLPLDDFDFSFRTSFLTMHKIYKLMSRTDKSLKVLDLTGTTNILNYNILNLIARFCPNLEELVLDNGIVRRKSAKEFARKVKGAWVRVQVLLKRRQLYCHYPLPCRQLLLSVSLPSGGISSGTLALAAYLVVASALVL